ncbi:transportin-1 [Vairimorpha necatrix]|uniref:Transportin-1 n=1 Tax=Vairimorpha necatrix TaxID=6039 RepID=A0AAX4JE85_9MICR
MEDLLFDILKNPSNISILKIESLLDTPQGVEMFISLLNNNNIIAFSYMKMQCKEWLLNPIRQDFIIKYKNIFYNLIETSNDQNLNLLCDFFEILFYNYFYWPDFIDFLVSKIIPTNTNNNYEVNNYSIHHNITNITNNITNNITDNVTNNITNNITFVVNKRCLKVLNSIFMKFRKLNKSDKLFLEIISCINKTKSLFLTFYLSDKKSDLSQDKNLLNIFFSLVYQDIHNFYEENIDKFIITLTHLYKLEDLQSTVLEIYNLFILKYPDLLDFTKILGSILISINRFDYLKYSVILNIIKKRKKEVCHKFEDVLVNAIKLGSILSEKEKEEMSTLEYNINILNNIDINRGILIDLVQNITEEGKRKVLINPQDEESGIFLYSALKIRNSEIIKRCQIIINNSTSDKYLSFISFRYLLSIKEYSYCDIEYIKKENICVYLCSEMISKYLQQNQDQFILQKLLTSSTSITTNNNYRLIRNIMMFLFGQEEDQYTLKLLNIIIRYNPEYMTDEIYKFLIEFCTINIRNINSPLAYQYIFDIFGIIINKENITRYEKDLTEIINIITTEEIIEVYNFGLYLLSIIIKHSKKDYRNIIGIISQDGIWKTSEMLIPAICLTISLYKRGYMTDEQINYIIQYLSNYNKYYSYILSDNTNNKILESENIEEYFIMKSINIKNIEEYYKIYKHAVEYFTNNYITKRNTRRVVRAFIRGSEIVKDEIYKNIVEKNRFNLSYENVPYSIYINFEI